MAELAAMREASRTQLVEHPIVMTTITRVLSSNEDDERISPALLIAACRCLTSLSRSVKLLRTTLVDCSIGSLLCQLVRWQPTR